MDPGCLGSRSYLRASGKPSQHDRPDERAVDQREHCAGGACALPWCEVANPRRLDGAHERIERAPSEAGGFEYAGVVKMRADDVIEHEHGAVALHEELTLGAVR